MQDTTTTARRLRRSTTDRRVAGVSGGLGAYLGVDPVVVRIFFVLAVFAGGTGLLAYLVAWVLVPDDDGTPAEPGSPLLTGDAGRIVGGVLLVVALLLVVDDSFSFGEVVVPLLLIGGGAWLLWRPRAVDHQTSPATPPAAPPAPPVHAGPPTGRITFTLVLLAIGALSAAAAAGADITVRHGLLTALGLTTLGLLVGAATGRARGLIALAAPLVAMLSLHSAVDIRLEDGIGERMIRPQSVEAIEDGYRLGVGSLELDLAAIPVEDFSGRRIVIDLHVGAGEVLVEVPDGITVEVDASIGAGEALLFGRSTDGTSMDLTGRRDGPEGAGTVVIVVDIGVGELTVR